MDKRKIDAIYSELLDLPPERRAEQLERLCGADQALRQEVEALLRAAEAPFGDIDGRFDSIRKDYWAAVTGDDAAGDEEDLSGQRVGVWRLEQQVGRGGLATVYRARREDGEFSQRAAFKVMRRGLDTDDLISRFRTEREILSALDHPCIARILDGGSTADGRPYLVLEYVDGVTITDYVTANALSLRDRVGLLRDVAAALHHAHQLLVVHRDVKPSNVMVTHDGDVRLLDFGIAKVLEPANLPISLSLTQTGIAMLTPSYGSPEQLRGELMTTRSDIYQLGLLMAEVISGVRPRSADGRAPEPVVDDISDRDLVAIIQKATREEINQRYDSASEFAAELDRYLTDRPVLARPDSRLYRFTKAIKRRPFLLPVGITFALAVAVYAVTITIYTRQIDQERQIAEQTQQFLIGLFQSPDPRAPADPERGRTITVVEALEIGRSRVFEELSGQPPLQASLSRTLSSVYEGLDQFAAAIELRELALGLEEALYGRDSWVALESVRVLARLYRHAGETDKAVTFSRRQLESTRDRARPDEAVLGVAEYAAGADAFAEGDYPRAKSLLDSALTKFKSADTVTHAIGTLHLLAVIEGTTSPQAQLRRIREAEALAVSTYGRDSVRGAIARAQVASSLTLTGNFAEAEAEFLDVLGLFEEKLGPAHSNTLSTLNNLGILYGATSQHAKAEAIHADLLARNLDRFGPGSVAAANSYQNLGVAVARLGRAEEALDLHQRAYDIYMQLYGASHYRTALPLLSSASIELGQSRGDLAEGSASEALVLLETSLPNSYLVGVAQCLVGLARHQQGDESGLALVASARPLMRQGNVPEVYEALCGIHGAAAP